MKYSMSDLEGIANSKGGKCLSIRYKNNHSKLKWRCDKGHIWYAMLVTILYGGKYRKGCWCPVCGRKKANLKHRLSIKYFQDLAEKKGGKCLSHFHSNSKQKLLWQCKEGHVWKAYQQNVSRGSWCPYCCGQKGISIKNMREIAKGKRGKCLSKEYINNITKLVWQCKEGHVWRAIPNNIKAGYWCPYCASIEHICERICRRYFELIFAFRFNKTRPEWLRSPKGFVMELDGYCKELKLAFEYNGEQHYINHNIYHRKRNLEQIKEYDTLKKKICNNNGVKLIIIPYWIKIENIRQYIIDNCKQLNILPKKIPLSVYDINLIGIDDKSKLQDMKDLALSQGGNCLSKNYINAKTKLLFKCKKGHIWKGRPDHIKRGHWCPKCFRK